MCTEKKYYIGLIVTGIILIMPAHFWAQPSTNNVALKQPTVQRTFTAPSEAMRSLAPKPELSKISSLKAAEPDVLSDVEPKIDIFKVKPRNEDHLAAGFYATYHPNAYDTVYIYDGATEIFEKIQMHAGKEVIEGDSLSVTEEVNFRMNHFNGNGVPVINEKHSKVNSMIIRSGFIPAQGFGTNRYRFAVKPGNFSLGYNSMISASVHLVGAENNIGTILCAITKIDYAKGIFYVETSNEVPKGENINWIIINSP
jgi:hypothetical protein